MSRSLTADEKNQLGIRGFTVETADVDGRGMYRASLRAKCPECGKKCRIYVRWNRLGGHPESSCMVCHRLYAYLPDK